MQAYGLLGHKVLPYFKKSERNLQIGNIFSRKYHGVEGELPVGGFPYLDDPSVMMVEAFHEKGLPIADYNGPIQLTVLNAQATTEYGQRVSTNYAFIKPIRYKRKNLTIKTESEAFKILINKNKVAYGVKYKKNGRCYTAYARKEVIACGGTFGSAKLLMLSGIGPAEHLSSLNISVIADLAVGENLQDHVTFNGIFLAVNKSSTLVPKNVILQEVCKYKRMKRKLGPLSGNGINNAIAFIKTKPNLIGPDIQYQIGNIYIDEYVDNVIQFERVPIFPTSFYDGIYPRPMNLVPKSKGKLLLNASNPHGNPLLYSNYFADPEDVIPVIKGYRFLITLENTKAFKSRGAYFVKTPIEPCLDFIWGSYAYLRCLAYAHTSPTHHQVGTCKMGPSSDKKAVVDAKLRVYGVTGLRVIDASIMPFVIRGNTLAPAIMIGERGVAFVIDYWLKRFYS